MACRIGRHEIGDFRTSCCGDVRCKEKTVDVAAAGCAVGGECADGVELGGGVCEAALCCQ